MQTISLAERCDGGRVQGGLGACRTVSRRERSRFNYLFAPHFGLYVPPKGLVASVWLDQGTNKTEIVLYPTISVETLVNGRHTLYSPEINKGGKQLV
jgi:hypothetical protein